MNARGASLKENEPATKREVAQDQRILDTISAKKVRTPFDSTSKGLDPAVPDTIAVERLFVDRARRTPVR